MSDELKHSIHIRAKNPTTNFTVYNRSGGFGLYYLSPRNRMVYLPTLFLCFRDALKTIIGIRCNEVKKYKKDHSNR